MAAVLRFGKWSFLLALLFTLNSWAVPIKPNVEKILQQQQQPARQYEPARAGWNGPEAVPAREASPNPVYEAYGPASTARAIRAALKAAATPDPGALLAIGLLILLWRLARQQRDERERARVIAIPNTNAATQESRAA